MRKVRLGLFHSLFPAQQQALPQRTLPLHKRKKLSRAPDSRNGGSVDKRSETVRESKASLGRQDTTCEYKPSDGCFREDRSLAFETPRRVPPVAAAGAAAGAEQRSNTADKEKKPQQSKPKSSKRSERGFAAQETTSVLSLSRLSSQLPGYRAASVAGSADCANDFTLFMSYEELNSSQGYLVSDIFDRVNRHLLPQVCNPLLARRFMESRFPVPQCYAGLLETFAAVELALSRLMPATPQIAFAELKREAFLFSKWCVPDR